jgi:hypothetical protein
VSRVVADPADLAMVAAQLEAAALEVTGAALDLDRVGAALPRPLDRLVGEVTVSLRSGLDVEAGQLRVLAGELRLVSLAVSRAAAGGIDVRLAPAQAEWLRRLEHGHGGPPWWPPEPLWPPAPGLRGPTGPPLPGPWAHATAPAVPREPGAGGPSAGLALGAVALTLAAARLLSQLGAASDPDTLRRLEELRRRQRQKQVASAIAGAPQPSPPQDREREIERNARELRVDPARFEALARDPGKGWNVDANGIEEARIAIRLERSGQLTDVVRSPDPRADLIEDGGAGQSWDVKSYRAGDFAIDRIVADIADEIRSGCSVIVNTSHLDTGQVVQVRQAVSARPWAGRVIFTSSE